MNQTNIEHLVIALILQALVGLLTGDWLAGALFGGGVFIGREHAQREYEIGNPLSLVGYEALDVWRWCRDAQLDLLFPVVGVLTVYAMTRIVQ